jgi:uncharacterized protein YceK
MNCSRFSRFSVVVCAAVAALGGCSSSSTIPFGQSQSAANARNRAGALEVLHVFHSPPRGMNPIAPIATDALGNLYGETSQGGTPTSSGGCGTVFELTPSGSGYLEKTLHKFRHEPDGCGPGGGLTFDSSGAIYGTTFSGGRGGFGNGTVFKLSPSGSGYAYKVLYRFKDGRDGAWPVGGVIVGANGVLYGATQYGASYACAGNTEGCGTVYSLTPNGSKYAEKILYVFKGGNDGLLPISGLAMDSSGALYGTTWLGGGVGSIGIGTVYKLTPSGSGYAEQVIHAFQGGQHDGAFPWAPVIIELNGDVDGTTQYGGSNDASCTAEGYGGNCGLVFRLTPSGSSYTESILHLFRGGRDGSQPQAPLTNNGGVLYGTTTDGATGFPCRRECGTVYALTPAKRGYANTVLYSFNERSGWFSRAGVLVSNGALYGTTYFQGSNHHYAGGTVFKLTP